MASWLSLLCGLVHIALMLSGVAVNISTRNDYAGMGLQVMSLFVAVGRFPLSVLAIVLSPRSTLARIGCLLPFVLWIPWALFLIYAIIVNYKLGVF